MKDWKEYLERIRKKLSEGGPGSGHHGHAGRPGQRGGSLPAGEGGGGSEDVTTPEGRGMSADEVKDWREHRIGGGDGDFTYGESRNTPEFERNFKPFKSDDDVVKWIKRYVPGVHDVIVGPDNHSFMAFRANGYDRDEDPAKRLEDVIYHVFARANVLEKDFVASTDPRIEKRFVQHGPHAYAMFTLPKEYFEED